MALALQSTRESGHEPGAESALAEQPAQEVGELEADEEGVGHGPGTEGRGDQHVACEAREAGEEGNPTVNAAWATCASAYAIGACPGQPGSRRVIQRSGRTGHPGGRRAALRVRLEEARLNS